MLKQPNRRRYFRFRYPISERPRLTAAGCEFHVTEISEEGARIRFSEMSPITFRRSTAARIVFADGVEAETEADRLRTQDGEIVLRFAPAIALKIVVAEQRRLLKKYPEVMREDSRLSYL